MIGHIKAGKKKKVNANHSVPGQTILQKSERHYNIPGALQAEIKVHKNQNLNLKPYKK